MHLWYTQHFKGRSSLSEKRHYRGLDVCRGRYTSFQADWNTSTLKIPPASAMLPPIRST